MTPDLLVARCRDLGVSLAPGPDGKLRVSPPGVLPEDLREQLKRHKEEILTLLRQQPAESPLPYINQQGELIIPFDVDLRYRWWAGGQSIAATLAELNAPPDVWRRYVAGYTERVQ